MTEALEPDHAAKHSADDGGGDRVFDRAGDRAGGSADDASKDAVATASGARSPGGGPAEADDGSPPSGSVIPPGFAEQLQRLGVQLGAAGLPPARYERQLDDESFGCRPRVRGADTGVDPARGGPGRVALAEALPGWLAANDRGSCWVSDVRRGEDESHGGAQLREAKAVSSATLAGLARDGSMQRMEIAEAAFLDTETTGLSGGAGTYAFLIGIGRFVSGTFTVRQLFMRDPTEEGAQLAELLAWLEGTSGLVTFNGRAFDVPLLDARFAMHGMVPPWRAWPHLDLLPPARRLWSRRLDSCSLGNLERSILGLERQDDVPGWMVPERYIRYQTEGDARPLVGVFKHNATDVLSMVSLAHRMARFWSQPDAERLDARDWLSLARAHELAGAWRPAMSATRKALSLGLSQEETAEALQRLGGCAKRARDWPVAQWAWACLAGGIDLAGEPSRSGAGRASDQLGRGPLGGDSDRQAVVERPVVPQRTRRLFPFEELAKYHEHRSEERDMETALEWALRARAALECGELSPRRGRRRAAVDLEHRIARLRRRIDARAGPADST